MLIKEAIDILSPSCRVRVETLKILRSKGMANALNYLKNYFIINESNIKLYNKLTTIDTRNINEEIN